MLYIIGQRRFDASHALWVAREIIRNKPDAVALELPQIPFQQKINQYLEDKISEDNFKQFILDFIGKELELSEKLIDKLSADGISERLIKEIEKLEPEGFVWYIIKAAKSVGARVLAIDVSFEEIEHEILKDIKAHDKYKLDILSKSRYIIATKKLPAHIIKKAESFHKPFHILEKIISHDPKESPFAHDLSCKWCKRAVKWERRIHSLYKTWVDYVARAPEKKVFAALHNFDLKREAIMSKRIIEIYRNLLKQKKTPSIYVIIHLWHTVGIENLLKKENIELKELKSV